MQGTRGDLRAAVERGDGMTAMALLEAGVLDGDGELAETEDAEGGSVLYHAVRSGELAVVEGLLDRGANPNENVPGGGALVAYALEEGRLAAAQLLFRSGATRRARSSDGSPVTFLAVKRGADWLLHELLEQGAGVNARDARGETLLHVAVRTGRIDLLKVLWGFGADTDAVNKQGESPLHVALGAGRPKMVAALLQCGSSTGLPDHAERLPVSMALEAGDAMSLRALLDNGARTDVTGADGRTLMEMALERREFGVARLLVKGGGNLDGILCEAVVKGDDELFDFLLAHGVDPNVSRARPPLLDAVRRGDERMAMALLAAGADPKVKGREGQSAFHMAMARDLTGTVTALLDRGAKVNEEFKYPASDEFLALVKTEGRIKWFLKKDRRVTPLMMAADRGNLPLARLLLARGAKTNVWTRSYRHWPINFASHRDDVKMMQLLLQRDPDQKGLQIKVDLSEQRAWVYDAKGKVLLDTKVSTGKKGYRTKTGVYVITNKYRRWNSTIYDGASMPYFQRLSCGDFGFHEGYCPGYAASHGCIRVPRGNASKLFSLTSTGDRVTIVE